MDDSDQESLKRGSNCFHTQFQYTPLLLSGPGVCRSFCSVVLFSRSHHNLAAAHCPLKMTTPIDCMISIITIVIINIVIIIIITIMITPGVYYHSVLLFLCLDFYFSRCCYLKPQPFQGLRSKRRRTCRTKAGNSTAFAVRGREFSLEVAAMHRWVVVYEVDLSLLRCFL